MNWRRGIRVGVVLGVLTALFVGGSAQATFPGANGKIVVSAYDGNDYELYEGFAPGLVNLTDNDGFGEQSPEWNAEGSMLVASCADLGSGDQPEICLYDALGAFLDTLTSTESAYAPTWNKPGNRVAFQFYDGHDYEIAKVGVSGNDTPVPITDTGTSEFTPRWSPNGRWILFSRQANSGNKLFRMRPDGTSIELLAKNVREAYSWSPDSKLIMFDRQVNIDSGAGASHLGGGDSMSDLFTMKANGSDKTNLTSTKLREETFGVWSPNQKWIAFIEERTSGLRLTKMKLSTGVVSHNQHPEGNFGQPTWQPVPNP